VEADRVKNRGGKILTDCSDLGNFYQGRNLWKWAETKVWYFVAALHTNFLCVVIAVCLSAGM
jgi:hypothetical protein